MKVRDRTTETSFVTNVDGRPLKVFITDSKDNVAIGAEAESIVPKGCRLITPQEALLLWMHNPNFREYLCNNSAVWTSQKGLDVIEGAYKIVGNSLEKVTLKEYNALGFIPENKAWQYSGNELVAVGGGYVGNRRFTLFGCVAEALKLSAAYTEDLSASKRD